MNKNMYKETILPNISKPIIFGLLLILSCISANAANTLIIKAHHPSDKSTVVRIWRTPSNKYIIRTSYSTNMEDYDQEVLYQNQKKVDYNGFAKRITFTMSDDSYWVLAYKDSVYTIVYGFYSEALNDIISISYIIDYINKEAYKNL